MNFVELTFNGKPILINPAHVVSAIPLELGGKSMTEIRLDQHRYESREKSSAEPVSELIRQEPYVIIVEESYAIVRALITR